MHNSILAAGFALVTLALGSSDSLRAQATLRVPTGFPTIAAAIGAAAHGDRILVDPGNYFENQLNLMGKTLELRSVAGPAATIIDGGGSASILECSSGEAPGTRVQGFTFRAGAASRGAGILVRYGARGNPINHLDVIDCIFDNNAVTFGGGAGISIGTFSRVTVRDCLFTNNSAAGGAGVEVFGDNGLETFARIESCTFRANSVTVAGGAGVMVEGHATAEITSCLFSGNSALSTAVGAAVYVAAPFGGNPTARISGCTMANNTGSALYGAQAGTIELRNSIVWGNTINPQIDALSFFGTVTFDIEYCNIQGPLPASTATIVVRTANNVSIDPAFVSPMSDDFSLQPGSPMIDAGDPSRIVLGNDAYGDTRMLDGDADGTIRPDLGSDEHALFSLSASPLSIPAGGSTVLTRQIASGSTPLTSPLLLVDVVRQDTFIPGIGQLQLGIPAPIAVPMPSSLTLTNPGTAFGASVFVQGAGLFLDSGSTPRLRLTNPIEFFLQ